MPRFKTALSPDYVRLEAKDAENRHEQTDPKTNATALSYDQNGQLFAAVWTKRGRTQRFRFRDADHRQRWIVQEFGKIAAQEERVAQRRAQRAAFNHDLKVGDVLVSSWGYEQTNIDFYEVTKVIGRVMVEIRKIASQSVESVGFMSEKVTARPGEYIGEPERRRVNEYGRIAVRDCASASKWNGTPQFASHYA